MNAGSPEHRRFYAQFARAAYDGPGKAKLPEGYEVHGHYSNRNRMLLVNRATKHAVFAFRGTDVKNRSDLTADALLAVGLKTVSSRFRNSLKYARQARNEFHDYKFSVTGHSLGGAQAAHVHSKIPNSEYVGFSNHTPVTEAQDKLSIWGAVSSLLKPRKKDSHDYVTLTDPISATTLGTSYGKNISVVPQADRNPHSLANFES